MKKICTFLRCARGAVLGVFLGSSLFRWIHFRKYPELYAMQSAPWYYGILTGAILTAICLLILSVLLYFAKKRNK